MAPHSCILAWRIPGTAESGGLPSMGSHRVGHNCSDLAATAAAGIDKKSSWRDGQGQIREVLPTIFKSSFLINREVLK